MIGCSGSPEPVGRRPAKKPAATRRSATAEVPKAKSRRPRTQTARPADTDVPEENEPARADRPGDESKRPRRPGKRLLLADLLRQQPDSESKFLTTLPQMQVDEAKAAAAGIRKLTAERLTLYTDLPPSPTIDELPEVFDQAFPQWCEYFHVDAAEHADWHMTGFLMNEKAVFVRTDFLPHGLPPFRHGYCRNYTLWLYEQPSDYYRRHLILHEGTHGFMNTLLGACGPPWYMEGIGELLATHRWKDGRLTLNHFPANREEVPQWGRIRIIKDAFSARRPLRLKQVIDYPPAAHLETEPYAWCWAAAVLMDRHPRYRERFRGLYKNVLKGDFTARFYRAIGDDWRTLSEEWQLFVSGVEYGHDIAATTVDFTPGHPLPESGATVTVSTKKGWQNTGVRFAAGATYRLTASGRYQVADKPQIWWCEPGGVSIRYYQARPLGILLAAVRPDRPKENTGSALLRSTAVGLGRTLTPKESGTLFLKINDSAAELGDNAGESTVEITRE